MMGVERKSMIISDEEKKNTAYHESGHTVVAKLLPKSDPVHKVTIIPRGRALGVTMQLPEQDRYSMDREHMLNVIAVLFGLWEMAGLWWVDPMFLSPPSSVFTSLQKVLLTNGVPAALRWVRCAPSRS